MNCKKCKREIEDNYIFCPFCGSKQIPEPRRRGKRPNGTGTIYKLSGRRSKPWVAAKNKVIIGYFETKSKAVEALEATAKKDITERYNMTFSEVYAEWSKEHYKGLGESGKDAYQRAFAFFEPLHSKKFRSLRTDDYQSLIDVLADKGRKFNTVSKYKQLITQMSEWARREELITTNFASFVKLPENKTAEKAIFTTEEIERIAAADSNDAAKIALMLLGTGMRVNELFSLELQNCFDDYVIGGSKTEAGKNRIIPIRPEVRKYFDYFKELSSGQTLLLDGYAGNKTIRNFRVREFYPLLEELGIHGKTLHSTRHTYASRAVAEGMSREVLQKILGHSSYELTANVYVHADAKKLIQEVNSTARY